MSKNGSGRDLVRQHLESGGLIVYPTSTLPGLGCLPIATGLDNLFSTKNRPENMPVSLGVANIEQVSSLVIIPEFLNHFLDSFTKGGITVILPAIESVDKRLGGNQIAIRVFSHPAAILLAEYGLWPCKGWSSVIGTNCAEPYTSLVEVWIMRVLLFARTASRIFRVPVMFVSI